MHSSALPSRPCTRSCERRVILSALKRQRLCHPRTHDTEGDDHIRRSSAAAPLRPDPCPCGRADARRGVRVAAPVDPPGCAGSSRSCARRVPRGSSTATAAGGRRTGWRTGSPSGWWSLPGPPMPASTRSTSPSAWQRIRRRRSTSRPGPSGGSSPPPRSPRRGRHAADPSDVARAPARPPSAPRAYRARAPSAPRARIDQWARRPWIDQSARRPWIGSLDWRRPRFRYSAPAPVAGPVTNRRCRADEPHVRARVRSARTVPQAHRPHLLRHRQQARPGARPGSVRAPPGAAQTRSGASCATVWGRRYRNRTTRSTGTRGPARGQTPLS
jgi:hypothetical protein